MYLLGGTQHSGEMRAILSFTKKRESKKRVKTVRVRGRLLIIASFARSRRDIDDKSWPREGFDCRALDARVLAAITGSGLRGVQNGRDTFYGAFG